MERYVRLGCCLDCVHYNAKKHKCTLGATDEGKPTDHFYADCPIQYVEVDDVHPVGHAHWIEKNNPAFSPFDGSAPYIFYCSHCGKTDGKKYPFCHVCGFKMDEETQR